MRFSSVFVTAALCVCDVAAQERVTFQSSGTEIVGYHYAPSSQGPAPIVIIAHGLGGLQTSRLQPFAERFAAVGYHAMTFDYRYWGQSAGQPRNIIDINSQHDDYRAAVAAAKKLPGVDGRVVLWGTSLSGGHVLAIAPGVSGLAGVIAQVPHTNGGATVAALPGDSIPGLIAAGLEDQGRGAFSEVGVQPLYIPIANKTGEYGALTQAGAYEGYQFVQPNPPPPGNVFPARFVLQIPFYNPDGLAPSSKAPTFIAVGLTDNVVTAPPAIELAERMNATLKEYPGGHFDVYPGALDYDANIADQLAFLQQNVPV